MSESKNLTRRDFVKAAGSAATASLLLTHPSLAQVSGPRRRYAIVGTGDRALSMWGRNVLEKYSDALELVGLCDINPKRRANIHMDYLTKTSILSSRPISRSSSPFTATRG